MIASLWSDWFSWPNGAVLTNLVASAICVCLAGWKVILWAKKLRKSHDELHRKLDAVQQSHQELHAKIDRVHQHLGITQESE